LVTSLGIDICQTVKIPKYGQVQCLTKLGLALKDEILSLRVNNVVYTCVPKVDGACNYSTSTNFPVVTNVSMTDNNFKLSGNGFQILADYLAKVQYNGVEA